MVANEALEGGNERILDVTWLRKEAKLTKVR